jgi:light-regulated signal transduction histidine kinase (bacteriophytochrome)
MRFLEMSPPNLNEARESLGCVVRDTDRAKDIVGRMGDHVQKAPPRREPFDLNEALGEVIDMVRSAIAKNGIAVSTRLTEDLIPVWGDRVQLQQVVVNLILNAVEAMGTVETGARELLISTELAPTGVLVAVRDSGPGIGSDASRSSLRRLLHHQVQRNRHGVVDLPLHHPCSWGQAVGGSKRASRCCISVHLARCRKRAHGSSSGDSADLRASRTHRVRRSSSTGLRR